MLDAAARWLAAHPFRYAALSLAACTVAALAGYGSGLAGLQAVTRYTGRAGLLWFSLIFVLAGSHRFAGGDAMRRALGITTGFAVHHTVHLALLLTYLHAAGESLNARAAGGMLGYAWLYMMVATANENAPKKMGPSRWRVFHQAGLWYLWIVFLLTYLPRLQGKLPKAGGGPVEFIACASLIALIALLRFAAFAKGKIGVHPSAPAH